MLQAKPSNYISMESRSCTPEMLSRLYSEGRTIRELKAMFDIRDDKVINRWFKQSGIVKRIDGSKYTFNENYFDQIDTADKAYWLGFIWCDGYVCKRDRTSHTAYEFKLDLSDQDIGHLYKFNAALESNYEVKRYENNPSGYSSKFGLARLYISKKYFPMNLYENYGLVPDRTDCTKVLSKVSNTFYRDFIRGIVDAEGSISDYYHFDGKYNTYKNGLQISTYVELIEFIQDHFVNIGLVNGKMKTYRRHEDRDANCVGLKYSGATQVPKILSYLYEDANTYLERKYHKYRHIIDEKASKVRVEVII